MRKIFASLLISIVSLFAFSISPAFAKVITSEKGSVTVAKSEIINDDLFVGAQAVQIDGVVNGDVFIGAQSVKITGTINGNLHAGANVFDLSGNVKGNIYIGAQSVSINGSSIGGSLIIGAATINIDKASSVGGSLIVGAGMLSLDSQVKRSVYAGAGSLTIGDNVKIGKDLYYSSGTREGEVNVSKGAKIAGNTYKSEINTTANSIRTEAAKKQLPAVLNAARFGTSLFSYISALVVGLIFIKLFGKHFTGVVNIASGLFWKSFGIGFLISITFIPGLIILALTIIGLPIAGIAILVFLLFSYFAKIVVGAALGAWLYQRLHLKASSAWAFALGLLVIYILKMIPIVGFLTGLAVLWAGVGALTLHSVNESR